MKRIVSDRRLIVSGGLAVALILMGAAVVGAAVTLMSFTATPEGSDIVIRWQTGSELDAAGFIVIRSTDLEIYDPVGDFVGASGNTSGASYVVTDTNVERGVTYYYILDSYDINNVPVETGPVSATVPLTPTSHTPTATSPATSTPTETPTSTPTRTPTVTATAPDQPAQNNPATATRLPTNTPTPLSVGASTITRSAPQVSTATATPRTAAPAGATAAASPTVRAASTGSDTQPVQTAAGAPPTASSTQAKSSGSSVEPSTTAQALVAMEPMVIATSAVPVASTPASSGGLNVFVIGLLVLAVLLVGAGLFAILRQTGR